MCGPYGEITHLAYNFLHFQSILVHIGCWTFNVLIATLYWVPELMSVTHVSNIFKIVQTHIRYPGCFFYPPIGLVQFHMPTFHVVNVKGKNPMRCKAVKLFSLSIFFRVLSKIASEIRQCWLLESSISRWITFPIRKKQRKKFRSKQMFIKLTYTNLIQFMAVNLSCTFI